MSAILTSPLARLPEPNEAWVGVGSNLGDRRAHIDAAIARLPDLVEVSPVLETEPWGITDQPWFLNCVVRIEWTGTPRALLRRCLAIEEELGRVREVKNGPRLIDLDVLLLGEREIDEEGLQLPHPGIAWRRSVLEPWSRVAPSLIVPGLGGPLTFLQRRAVDLPGQRVREI